MNLSDALSASPALFPLNMTPDGSAVQFIRLAETDYAAASFLDNRLITSACKTALIPWPELAAATTNLTANCDFIFHISHAGSTLLSRLLGMHPAWFSVREPAILRLLGQGQFPDRIDTFIRLWSRTFHPQQKAIIKATSFVSEMAVALLERVLGSRAVLMYVPAQTFLPALLDGAMSDIESLASQRLQRVQHAGGLTGLTIAELSPGELVAMSWLAEMQSLALAAEHFPARTLWLNFDQFLLDAEAQLLAVCVHLGVQGSVEPLLASSVMQRYAKKPEVMYDRNFRQQLLRQAEDKFATEIDRGLLLLRPFQASLAGKLDAGNDR